LLISVELLTITVVISRIVDPHCLRFLFIMSESSHKSSLKGTIINLGQDQVIILHFSLTSSPHMFCYWDMENPVMTKS